MSGEQAGYMWNLDERFKKRMQALIKASNGRISVISGYRSNEHQQRLYNQAVAKHGAANAGRWAAKPGRSNHNHGLAMDLRFANDAAKKWAHDNASRFGLNFPMSWEPWHIEPAGLKNGSFKSGKDWKPGSDSYTFFDGMTNPVEQESDFANRMTSVLSGMLKFPGEHTDDDGHGHTGVDMRGTITDSTMLEEEEEVSADGIEDA